MPENQEKLKELLQKLSVISEGVYIINSKQIWSVKNNKKHAERIKVVSEYWMNFFSQNPDILYVEPGVFLDFRSYHWFMKFICSLTIAVRFIDDSKLFTISFILGEIAETIKNMVEQGIFTIELMDSEDMIRLRHEFYEFLRSNLGTGVAVKYANKIYSLDQKSGIKDWKNLITLIEQEARKLMGPFIARGIESSLEDMVKKYYKIIKLREEKNE